MKIKVRPKAVLPCRMCEREIYGADRYELKLYDDDETAAEESSKPFSFCSTKCVLDYYLESREDTLKKVLRDG